MDVILRRTADADLDFVVRTEAADANRAFVVGWPRERHRTALADSDILHLIVAADMGSPPVGFVILAGLTNPNHCVEFRRIVIAYKGRGLGRAAVWAVMQMAFDGLGAHRLWLDVKLDNGRARHLYASEGFVEEGVLRECLWTADRYESLVVMSMLREEFEQRRLIESRPAPR